MVGIHYTVSVAGDNYEAKKDDDFTDGLVVVLQECRDGRRGNAGRKA